jgi:hypothetical protein
MYCHGRIMQRHQTNKCWLVFALCLVGYIAGSYALIEDRATAFIGYNEDLSHCKDQLPDCEESASLNKCITDPHVMRALCPLSCGLEPCVSSGTLLVSNGTCSCSTSACSRSCLADGLQRPHFLLIAAENTQVQWQCNCKGYISLCN